MSRRDVATALRSMNPVPDPEQAVAREHSESLFASIERRRQQMLDTDLQRANEVERSPSEKPRLFRRSAVLVAVALAVLVAVPAVADLWDEDLPRLEGWFASGDAELTVYGEPDGVGPGCAWAMSFGADATPVMAGQCGVLRLDGDGFAVASDEVLVSGLQDIAVGLNGAVWLASVDDDIQEVTGDDVFRHPFKARTIAVDPDGVVWASSFIPAALPTLMSYDGTGWTTHDVGPVDEVMITTGGVVWTIGLVPTDYDPETSSAPFWEPMVGRFAYGEYVREPIPGGAEYGEVAPDGALWAIREVTDTASELVRFDGDSWSTMHAPIAQINDLAIHPDGTVWVTSSIYGAFSHNGSEWLRYGVADGLPAGEVTFVEIGPAGNVWIGTHKGVVKLDPIANS